MNNTRKKLYVTIIILLLLLICLVTVFCMSQNFGSYKKDTLNQSKIQNTEKISYTETPSPQPKKKIVVLDPGHGKSSQKMSDSEKEEEMWIYNPQKGWGEWRHWKSGTVWDDCEGTSCSGRAPKGGSCWYRMTDGDRDTEPNINLNNCLSAKKYLENMGYEVRMTRQTDNENPSMTKRLTYCYKDCDYLSMPDADIFVCVHSNAGGGKGSAYMSLSGNYDQDGVLNNIEYINESNRLGQLINNRIVSQTSLSAFSGGKYDGFPTTILFCKSPIPIAYLEIGFFDDSSDLDILNQEYDAIDKSIADGINDYFS